VLVREAPLTHRRRFSGRGCGSPPGGSRWVEAEQWHPHQKLSKSDSGELELEVPYHDPRELVGDVLRDGRDCEVVSPENLREAVAGEVRAMAGVYSVG